MRGAVQGLETFDNAAHSLGFAILEQCADMLNDPEDLCIKVIDAR
jgi:hypothetical protein